MKILAVGLNYPSHVDESALVLGQELKRGEPIIFHKGDSILRPNAAFYLPEWSEQIDYEVELVVKISRVGKHIATRFAHRYYDEVSVGIDFTARDLQRRAIASGQPWVMSKAFDYSAAVGRWVRKDVLGYPERPLEFSLCVDGELRQQGSSADMIHSIDELIAYVSQFHTLKMGDILFTGTPAGVGACSIGQRLEACIGREILLTVPIK